jgi:hypothetical protein
MAHNPGAATEAIMQQMAAASLRDNRAPLVSGKMMQPGKYLRYDNSDRSLYPAFRVKLGYRLQVDGEEIGDEKRRVWFCFNSLDEEAAKRILPWIVANAEFPAEFKVEKLLKHMDKAFGDPRAASRAMDKLHGLAMKGKNFREFVSIFDKLVLEAGGTSWNDVVKKGLLRGALSFELKDRLVSISEAETYELFVDQIREISDRLEEVKGQKKLIHTHNYGASLALRGAAPVVESMGDPMDWEATVAAAKIAAAKGAAKGPKQRAKWVDKETYLVRKTTGVCFRCGGSGHRVAGCPYEKPQRPGAAVGQIGKSTQSNSAPAKPLLDSDSEADSEESENE